MAKLRMGGVERLAPWMTTLLLLALLCGLLVYWAMQLLSPPVTIAPTGSLVSDNTDLDTAATSRLFGNPSGNAPAATSRAAANVTIIGIAASDYRPAVILTIDGKPAQAYGIGDQVDDNTTVESVSTLEVVLNRQGEKIKVEVPSQTDMAILTSGQSDEASATTPPTPTRRAGAGPSAARHGATSTLPALPPRRLPPAGAAAAAAAANNTTGLPPPSTPNSSRPAAQTLRRQASPTAGRPAVRNDGAGRSRLGNPAAENTDQPQTDNQGQQEPQEQEQQEQTEQQSEPQNPPGTQ